MSSSIGGRMAVVVGLCVRVGRRDEAAEPARDDALE